MGEVVLLSLTASLNPTLVAATTVMLLLDKPARLMGGYLLGAYVTSITLGLIMQLPRHEVPRVEDLEQSLGPVVLEVLLDGTPPNLDAIPDRAALVYSRDHDYRRGRGSDVVEKPRRPASYL